MLKKVLIILITFTLILFFVNCKNNSSTENLNEDQELTEGNGFNNIAFDFTEKDENGKDFTLSSFKGKIILLVFSTEWCGPCNSEASKLESLYAKYKARGFEIVQVMFQNMDGNPSDKEDLKRWIDTYKLSFKVLNDPDSSTVNKYNVSSIPLNLIIDKNFVIKYRATGFYETAIENKINDLLNQ